MGSLRIDDCEKEYSELSWMVAPDKRGQGLGKQMLQHFLENHPGRYQAEIKPDNIGSIRIAETCGFVLDREEKGRMVWVRG